MAEVDEEQKRSFLDNGGVEGRSSQKVLFPHTTADIVISSSGFLFLVSPSDFTDPNPN